MKDKTVPIDNALPNSVSLGKTIFRISRIHQSGRPAAAAFASHIHKIMNPTEKSLCGGSADSSAEK